VTKYQVLKATATDGKSELYAPIGTADGHNDDDAINNFLAAGDNGETYGEGDYRAVPARSWREKPHTKKKKISFG
jgi:hypothetical protein